jgi:hypothetical protein
MKWHSQGSLVASDEPTILQKPLLLGPATSRRNPEADIVIGIAPGNAKGRLGMPS